MLFKQNLPPADVQSATLETLCREHLPILGYCGPIWSDNGVIPVSEVPFSGVKADITALLSALCGGQAVQCCDAGRCDTIEWLSFDGLRLTAIHVPTMELAQIESVTESSYSKLLAHIAQSDYGNLLRFWNFLPQINCGGGDLEAYRRFCTARLHAFRCANIRDGDFPAASAVGHQQHSFTLIALSSQLATRHHANPLQVDAYRYPRQYGPSSPSFARASSVELPAGTAYFVSGTASIVGHESRHSGDLIKQLFVTKSNIIKLLDGADLFLSDVSSMRIYLRNASDFDECKAFVEEAFPGVDAVFLHADICRKELLVEIECICTA